MRFGFSPNQSQQGFHTLRAQAQLAEDLGFDILWVHEHHSQAQMYPDPLMTLAAVAPVTTRIGLGTNMLLLPIHHPVRVAQAAAMLDVLCDGRLHFGVANGYSPNDLDTFGVASSNRGARMTAGLELIRALWTGEKVTRSGEDFRLDGFRLFPRPVQKPFPTIYVGGHAKKAIERAARLGDRYLISTTQSMAEIPRLVDSYHEALRACGSTEKQPYLNRIVCAVRNSREKQDAEHLFGDRFLSAYDQWGHESVTGLSPESRDYARLGRDQFIIGEADECIERIEAYSELGIEHIACLMNFASPDLELVDRSMRLFGEKIIPHFQ
jgi:probable F420-dependent oxidoreductase